MREAIQSAIGEAARVYVRYSPIDVGKATAADYFQRFAGWRQRVITTKTVHGVQLELELPDLVAKVIYLTGWWEHSISRYVMRNLKPGDRFVDVGANVGYYTLLAASIVGESGKVFAVEASPEIARRLERNVLRNRLRNVEVIHAAAAEERGTAIVFSGPAANKGATTVVESVAGTAGMQDSEHLVPAMPLSDLVGSDLYSARMIKVDVEGSELAIVRTLDLERFSTETEWLMELMPWAYAVEDVLEPFRTAGYRVYRLENSYDPDYYLYPATRHSILPLKGTPDRLTDVLITRRKDVPT